MVKKCNHQQNKKNKFTNPTSVLDDDQTLRFEVLYELAEFLGIPGMTSCLNRNSKF